MNGETRDGPETSPPDLGWGWVFWPGVLLLLYVFSIGPVAMLENRNLISSSTPGYQALEAFYWPARWALEKTPLRKPLVMYLSLWVPEWYGGNGKYK